MSYYHGLISSRKANAILSKARGDGCFLIRDSQSQPGHFVLSIRYGGKVYHVLIFHETGEYFLDSNGENGDERFTSLEELVLFSMSHELRVAGDEVLLQEPIICDDGTTALLLNPFNGVRKIRESSEDCDILTDLFASVFGSHCSVLVVIHSQLQFDGQLLSPGQSYLVCVVKDNQQRAFFIRTINTTNREIIGEKKITKHFEYDLPSELVLTFLSEHGITCIGFRDEPERDMFLRHVDRIIQLQQERAVKLRVRNHSSTSPPRTDDIEHESPTEMKYPVKAEEFDIYNLSPEWQYLFEQAGVSRAMLEDMGTLQFILDKVYEMGGAPKQFHNLKISSTTSDERTVALAMDSALRHETLRASRLADELQNCSTRGEVPQPIPRKFHPPTCTYSGVCTRYKELLLQRSSLSALSPVQFHCYCCTCAAGKPVVSVSGSPPHQYTLPIGWCQFILRSQTHSLSQKFCSNWHVAFSSVPATQAAGIIRTGRLIHQTQDNNTLVSPDIKWAKLTANIKPELYHDEVERMDFRINVAFQIFVQPGSYNVEKPNGFEKPLQQLWHAPERTYITYALLIYLQPL